MKVRINCVFNIHGVYSFIGKKKTCMKGVLP